MTGPDLPSPPREQDYAEETAAAIDKEVRTIVQGAMERALDILRSRRDVLERSARRLLEKETLDEKELTELVGPPAGPPVRVAAE
jgi:cell division protease FtsH